MPGNKNEKININVDYITSDEKPKIVITNLFPNI